MTLEIRVEQDRCMGSGNCSFWAPKAFELGDDGIAVVLDPEGEPVDRIALAAQGCPTQAITLLRDGQLLT